MSQTTEHLNQRINIVQRKYVAFWKNTLDFVEEVSYAHQDCIY